MLAVTGRPDFRPLNMMAKSCVQRLLLKAIDGIESRVAVHHDFERLRADFRIMQSLGHS